MNRQRWAVTSIVIPALALAVAFWPRGPRPCLTTFEQVREGMTFEEVCATVGGPPGDYSGGDSIPPWWLNGRPSQEELDTLWIADHTYLKVGFDDGGRVTETRVGEALFLPEPSLWIRLRGRLGI